jgi:hypothetical protein
MRTHTLLQIRGEETKSIPVSGNFYSLASSNLFCSMEEYDAQSLFDGFTEAGDRNLR